jgi:hypothetical protein
MSDEQLDVLIAVYLIPDLAQQDFDSVVKLIEDGKVQSDGVVLVDKDAEGKVEIKETGDHLGRKGAKVAPGSASSSACSHRRYSPPPRSAQRSVGSPGSSPNIGSPAESETSWTTRCHQARPASSRSTTMLTPAPSPRRSRTPFARRPPRSIRPRGFSTRCSSSRMSDRPLSWSRARSTDAGAIGTPSRPTSMLHLRFQ